MYVGTNTAQYTTSTFVLTAFSEMLAYGLLFCVGLRRLFTTYRIADLRSIFDGFLANKAGSR